MWDPCSLSPSLVHPNLGLVRIGGIGLFLVFSGRNRLGRIEIWLEPLEPFVWAWTGCKPDPVQIFSSFHGLEQTLAQSPPDRILAVGHDAALAPQEVKRRRRRTTPTIPTTPIIVGEGEPPPSWDPVPTPKGFPSRHSAITPVLFFPAAICACAIGRQVTAHNDAGVCRRPLDRQLGSVAANERSCRLIH
eukprot:XP_020406137.1 uncharacterized protein LOC103651488 isoform X2 [Zea mays]